MHSVARPIQIPSTQLDSPAVSGHMVPPAAASASGSEADEPPRMAKFLCSFGGSILPRPLDGRLRYVGGDTRIVMLPRDISYSDLLTRMRELFEGVDVIKYQQPDEDLDALVSVVSDDDVMNMMEEYDKLIAAGEGFTRLRIFLFSQHLDGDVASVAAHYNGDEWDTERRYVDALNNLGDVKTPTSPVSVEQLFGIGGSESGFPNNIGLRHLNVPRPSYSQRYGEMDSPWSPAYVSPGHYGVHDPREFPISPSSARFQIGAEDFDERIPDDFVRYSPKYRHYENHSPPHVDNLVWLPPGAVIQEKAGFPGNLSHPNSSFGGNHICEHCHSPFQKGQSPITDARLLDPHWQLVQPHFDQSSMANEYVGRPANSCVDCCRTGEHYMVHQDARLENGVFVKEQTDHPPTFYNELYNHDRGWRVHTNQSHQRYEDTRLHLPGNGRMVEPYVVDGNSVNSPFTQGKVYEMHSTSTSRSSHESTHCCHVSSEHNNDMYYNQQVGGGGSYVQPSGFEESTGQHLMYGADSFYQMQQNLPPIQSLRRNANSPVHAGSPYEAANLPIQNGGINSSFVRNIADVSPRIPGVAAYDRVQNPWPSPNVPYRIVGNDSPAAVENPSVLGPWSNPNTGHDVRPLFAPDLVQRQPGAQLMEIHPERAYNELMLPTQIDGKEAGSALLSTDQQSRLGTTTMQTLEGRENQNVTQNVSETKHCYAADNPTPLPPCVGVQHGAEVDLKQMEPTEHKTGITRVSEPESTALQKGGDVSEGRLSLLPELIASVKKAVLEDSEETVKAQSNASPAVLPACDNDEKNLEESMNGKTEADLDSDLHGSSEQQKVSKIESTTAEAEALAKGLQTIKNDDLEEIRELGSGTYGAVYHGKWRGSDVAIKRIKSSCFAGRPSERARLIADFWKEALILSSLHHPNVVSFYGVVRDGPDGSLATVTEFMVNGSLKQFLKKKDRTIDRRKRLILAMDAAFGMEYLHGKNIVHFDLKCENLLVNMRDPHRPICKIGDLGLSKVKQHTLVSGGVRGTLPWMAPELLNGKSNMVSEKIDVYSFGIVMWELLTGEEPYSDMRCASIIGGIVNNTLRPQIPSWCDPEWKSLMESCWAGDPAERPSFSEISQTLRKMAAAMNVK